MPDVTDDEIKALLDLEARCTPGPWGVREHGPSYGVNIKRVHWRVGSEMTQLGVAVVFNPEPHETPSDSNAALIADSRNALRPVLESLLREREALRRAEEALAFYGKHDHYTRGPNGRFDEVRTVMELDHGQLARETLAELHRLRATQTPEPGHD